MLKKGIFVSLLVVPVVIVAFLYVFGQNKYTVKHNPRLPSKPALNIIEAIGKPSSAVLVGLADSSQAPIWMQKRVEQRLGRLHSEGGGLPFYYLFSNTDSASRQTNARQVLVSSLALAQVLTQDLGFPSDTGGLGYWYILLDAKGHPLNAYDLRQERLLDTLALEATIVSQGK